MKHILGIYLIASVILAVGPAAHAQSGASPFGKTPVQGAPALSKLQALAGLTAAHKSKVEARLLDRLMDQPVNDVLVEFVQDEPAGAAAPPGPLAGAAARLQALAARKSALQRTKQAVKDSLALDEFEPLADYDALPMAYGRVNGRAALVKLLRHGNVKAIHENKAYQHQLAESLPLIHQPQAAAAGKLGAGTTVVVLDTGLNYTRAEFGSCTAPGVPASCRVVAALDAATDDGALDANGHGTNVAAIVAGVAPGSKLVGIDVFDGGSAFSNVIVNGINWAINHAAAYNIVAMNLSLGGSVKYTAECPSGWATSAFKAARDAGIVPVVAAGNQGWADGVAEPACSPGAVRVGAVYDANFSSASYSGVPCTDSAIVADRIACFSNGGSLVTVLAPGAVITAGGYLMTGTSQAAPHVAGAIAVLRAPNAAPADSLDQTVARLTSTGVPLVDSRNGLSKPRLDVLAAVRPFVADDELCVMVAPNASSPAFPMCL